MTPSSETNSVTTILAILVLPRIRLKLASTNASIGGRPDRRDGFGQAVVKSSAGRPDGGSRHRASPRRGLRGGRRPARLRTSEAPCGSARLAPERNRKCVYRSLLVQLRGHRSNQVPALVGGNAQLCLK